MPRTRQARPELSESWADVDDDQDASSDAGENSISEDERSGRRDQVRSSRVDFAEREGTPKRGKRSYGGPELVMPRSPNAVNGKQRSNTPHFRLNKRSMTSDAGHLDVVQTQRAQTPRLRMNDRSMTSDAGKFTRKASTMDNILRQVDEEDEHSSGHLNLLWTRILEPVLSYFSDIVGQVLQNAKPLIAYALFAYLLVASMIFGSGFLTSTINNALSPICRVPGVVRFFNPGFCPHFTAPEVAGPAEFDKLVQVQAAFDDVLAASSTGVNLPLDMKRSEASIRDLRSVVEYSNLPSKNELVFEFSGFIETAKHASQDLSKFNSHIGRAVDHILSTNRWTLRVIADISDSNTNRGSIPSFFSEYLNVFAPFQPVTVSRDLVLDQYLKHTAAVEEQINSLLSEAHALLNVLDNLDGRLGIIYDIAMKDNLKVEENKDQLLANLWTKVGGNRSTVKRVNKQLELLQNVGQYRRIAWAQVSTTIVKLQSMRDNIEDLRQRVAMPELVGTDRVPLEVHIEAINLGLQRLEEQRESSRRVEKEAYQRVFDRAEAGARNMIGEKEL